MLQRSYSYPCEKSWGPQDCETRLPHFQDIDIDLSLAVWFAFQCFGLATAKYVFMNHTTKAYGAVGTQLQI
jgi:hypothetical protein